MPFVTEELYHRLCLLTGEPRNTIMNASYPVPGGIAALRSAPAEDAMETVFKVSGSIRSLRATYLKGSLEKHAPEIYVVSRNAPTAAVISTQTETNCSLARSSKEPPPAGVQLVPVGCNPAAARRGPRQDTGASSSRVSSILEGRGSKGMRGVASRLEPRRRCRP